MRICLCTAALAGLAVANPIEMEERTLVKRGSGNEIRNSAIGSAISAAIFTFSSLISTVFTRHLDHKLAAKRAELEAAGNDDSHVAKRDVVVTPLKLHGHEKRHIEERSPEDAEFGQQPRRWRMLEKRQNRIPVQLAGAFANHGTMLLGNMLLAVIGNRVKLHDELEKLNQMYVEQASRKAESEDWQKRLKKRGDCCKGQQAPPPPPPPPPIKFAQPAQQPPPPPTSFTQPAPHFEQAQVQTAGPRQVAYDLPLSQYNTQQPQAPPINPSVAPVAKPSYVKAGMFGGLVAGATAVTLNGLMDYIVRAWFPPPALNIKAKAKPKPKVHQGGSEEFLVAAKRQKRGLESLELDDQNQNIDAFTKAAVSWMSQQVADKFPAICSTAGYPMHVVGHDAELEGFRVRSRGADIKLEFDCFFLAGPLTLTWEGPVHSPDIAVAPGPCTLGRRSMVCS